MNTCKGAYCPISRLEDLNAEAVQLAVRIRKNFEDLGI